MSEGKYRFNLYIVAFEEDRKLEVVEVLKHLHPKSGKDYFKRILDGAREGRSEAIYQTNNKNDAFRTADLVYRRGATPELEDLFPEQDEDDL